MSRPRARSRNSARAVRKTIGMRLVAWSRRSSSATRQPSSRGIITSRRITSGPSVRAWSSPLGPSAASRTSMPSASRLTRHRSRIGASSSITRTFVISCPWRRRYTRRSETSLHRARYPHPRERQLEREGGPLAFRGVDGDPAAHRLHEALRDEEAEAGAACATVAGGGLGSVELPEDPLLFGGGDPDPFVRHLELDLVRLPPRGHRHGAARGRVADRIVEEDGEDLAQLLRIGRGGDALVGHLDDEAVLARAAFLHGRDDLRDEGGDVGGRDRDLEVAGVEPSHVEKRVDDARQALRLRRDVAQERAPLLLAEEDVLAEEGLGEAVDRRQRRPKLVRDGRDELGLHLLDGAVGGDVSKREDPAGHEARRVAHDGLRHRQPRLLAAADDRDEAVAGGRLAARLELAAEHLRRRVPERLLLRDAGDLLGRLVPEDDVALAVDGDDAVGDVGEDREAPLLLERDPLVELGVRERRRGVPGERPQRLDLFRPPRPGALAVDREDSVQGALGSDERHAEVRRAAVREHRVGADEPRIVGRALDRDRRPRLHDVAGERARGGRARAERRLRGLPLRGRDDELVLLQDADRARLGADEPRRLLDDLVEDRGGIELGREQAARPRELLRQRPRRALRLEELRSLEGAPRRSGEVARELEILVLERAALGGEDEDEPAGLAARPLEGHGEHRAAAAPGCERAPVVAEAVVVGETRSGER